MKGTKDMSKGSPLKLVLLFTLPLLLSNVFQQLYNVADSVIAGRLIGENALAAVSVSFPITMIFAGFGLGMGMGCSVVCGRAYGEKNISKLKTGISTAFISLGVISLVLAIVGYLVAKPVLSLLGTPQNVLEDSVSYLAIYTLGLPFILIYNLCSSAFQSLGNSKIPLFFLIFSTVFNVILDVIFITVFRMGVWGLALATTVAQGVACILSLVTLVYTLTMLTRPRPEKSGAGFIVAVKHFFYSIYFAFATSIKSMVIYIFGKKEYKRFETSIFSEIMKVGIPSTVQHSSVSIGQLFIQNLINSYGSAVIAGYGAAMKINSFCISILATASNALTIFISQNIGANRYDRLKKGVLADGLILLTAALIITPITVIFPETLVSIFIDGELSPEVIKVGKEMVMIITPFYLVVSVKFICDNALKGSGKMFGFILSTGVDIVLRVVFAYTLSPAFGAVGIWWSWPPSWIAGMLIAVGFMLFSWLPMVNRKQKEQKEEKIEDAGGEIKNAL